MFEFIPELGELVWIILPLLILQITLIVVGIWEWNRKKDFLGQNKIIWLLIIIFINFFGSIIFLIYSQRLNLIVSVNQAEIDDWRA